MSAWSDYKCGAITADDYAFACLLEEIRDRMAEEQEEDEGDEDESEKG